MKKILLFIALSCFIAINVQAQQEGLYLGAGFGYGFRAGGTVIGSNDYYDGSSKVVKGSMGKGGIPNVTVGYLITPSAGVELAVGGLVGTRTGTLDVDGGGRGNSNFRANSFYLNPSFVIRASSVNTLVPYAKVGMFLGLVNHGVEETNSYNINGAGDVTQKSTNKFEYKGGIATGLTSALGLDIMLSSKFAIFGELIGRLASWAPNTYTSTTNTTPYVGGNAQATQTSSVSGNFVKETPANYTGTNTPERVLPFSAIGFNVGVKLYLNQ